MSKYHISILSREILEVSPNSGVVVDCTLGGGGHSKMLYDNLSVGKLISFDRDQDALSNSLNFGLVKENEYILKKVDDNKEWIIIKSNFSEIKDQLNKIGIEKVDFIISDIGVSSYQIDEDKRGFSFNTNGPLDMRMDKNSPLKARDLVNGLSSKELERIFREYGEERYAKKIAEAIVRYRQHKAVSSTFDIVEIIEKTIGNNYEASKNPSRRIFQALRIAVNNELGELESLCHDLPKIINEKGQIVILTFHSLERKIVEESFKDWNIRKVSPSDNEIKQNPRAKSCIGYFIKIK